MKTTNPFIASVSDQSGEMVELIPVDPYPHPGIYDGVYVGNIIKGNSCHGIAVDCVAFVSQEEYDRSRNAIKPLPSLQDKDR